MYNWKSCKLAGKEIISLRANGFLVWEKLIDSPFEVYFCTLSDDFDLAMQQFSELNLENLDSLDYNSEEIEFTSVGAGRPIILTKGNVNNVQIAFWEDKPVEQWFPKNLSNGVVSVDVEGEFDIPQGVNINGNIYKVWTPDGEDFDYIIPIGHKCKLNIS